MEKGSFVISWLIIGILIIIVFWLWSNKIFIDVVSFFRRTLPLDMGVFGVYLFEGKQGTGKTYSLTKYLIKHGGDKKIYSNMTLGGGLEYEPIKSVEHLLSLRDERNIYIVFDEIFSLLGDKTIPKDIREDLSEFLSQQRKVKNILFTTAQEWLNIPIDFRRYVRIWIQCDTRPLGRFGGLLIETYKDGRKIQYDDMIKEYDAPVISKKFSKYERKIMLSYDTYERIKRLNRKTA